MSSGLKTMVINTRERAISSDINRLQQFLQAGQAEFYRWLLNVNTGDFDSTASSTLTQNVAQTSPETGEIVNGLCFRPQVASVNALIDPGCVCMVDPDGATTLNPTGSNSPDDSVYKIIADLGVTSGGTLALTANASGSTRIDVVEIQRAPAKYTTTESRDIYNTTTGQFTASSVTKTSLDGLNYRIRTGTAGAGFPGTVQGWMPIAVCSVPTGTTTWDTVTVWDVRPLLTDRSHGLLNVYSTVPSVRATLNGSNTAAVTGRITATYKGRRIGGALRRGSPGTSANSFDMTDAANQSAGMSLTGQAFSTLYLVLPFGLPRWSRYTDAASGARTPQNPCGIPVMSAVTPAATGIASAAVPLPSSLGFGSVSDSNAVSVCTLHFTTTTTKFSMAEDWVFWGAYPNQSITGDDQNVSLTLTAGTHYPLTAQTVDVTFWVPYTGSVSDSYQVFLNYTAGPSSAPSLYSYLGGTATWDMVSFVNQGGPQYGFSNVRIPTGHTGTAIDSSVSMNANPTTTSGSGSNHLTRGSAVGQCNGYRRI